MKRYTEMEIEFSETQWRTLIHEVKLYALSRRAKHDSRDYKDNNHSLFVINFHALGTVFCRLC